MFGAVSGIFGMSPLSDLMNNQVPEGWEWLAPGASVALGQMGFTDFLHCEQCVDHKKNHIFV